MKKRKTLLSVAHEFLAALPHLFKHRPMQLMFIGIGVIAISLPVLDYYNTSQWLMLIPAFIGIGFIVLGVLDLPEHEKEETEHIREESGQDLKDIKRELKEIRNRLEKIEERYPNQNFSTPLWVGFYLYLRLLKKIKGVDMPLEFFCYPQSVSSNIMRKMSKTMKKDEFAQRGEDEGGEE
ncbi:MAG: hypothetical protein KKA79_03420 [Nanoarchaeota archaeon]|nr:hypothetical protein [Nanoarchaeota archaeon]